MRTPLSVLTVLAALPVLALAQNLSMPNPAPRSEALFLLPVEPTNDVEAAAMAARTGARPVRIGSGPSLPEREVREWTVSLAPTVPPLTLSEGEVKLSGPLVDTFRVKARAEARPERSLGRRILDLPVINLFVPQPMPKPTRVGSYLSWGERDSPWMVVCDRHHDGDRGVWLMLH